MLAPLAWGQAAAQETAHVVRSFYELPDTGTVMTVFPGSESAIQRQFQEAGIALTPLPGNDPPPNGSFVGQSWVVAKQLHGTKDAPFSRSMFTIMNAAGIKLAFAKPQAMVAMTITGPTTDTDVGLDLRFYDQSGELIRSVNADTHHDKSLGFDSRGAVFRGLQMNEAKITSLEIVPTRIPESSKVVLAGIDYFCFSPVPPREGIATVKSLVSDLGHENYKTRESATRNLSALSPSYLPLLKGFKDGDDPEVRLRLRSVIQALESRKVNLTPDGTEE